MCIYIYVFHAYASKMRPRDTFVEPNSSDNFENVQT